MSGVTTADSAARADWIGCEPNARTSAVPRMRKVDIATPLRLILRKRDLMFACLLQLTLAFFDFGDREDAAGVATVVNKGCVSW